MAIATPSWHIDNTTTQGILWGLASGLFLAFLTLLNRRQVSTYSASVITLYQMGIVSLLLLPVVLVLRPVVTPHDFALLAMLGVVFTGGAQLLFLLSLRGVPARVAGVVSSGDGNHLWRGPGGLHPPMKFPMCEPSAVGRSSLGQRSTPCNNTV